MAQPTKRPLLPLEDRLYLAAMVTRAGDQTGDSPNRAYAQGVIDVLSWLIGADMTRLLEEVTR